MQYLPPESSVNDTMSDQNASQWSSNGTPVVFAQEDNTGMTIGG